MKDEEIDAEMVRTIERVGPEVMQMIVRLTTRPAEGAAVAAVCLRAILEAVRKNEGDEVMLAVSQYAAEIVNAADVEGMIAPMLIERQKEMSDLAPEDTN